jgi:hypothetical protein
MVPLIKKLQQNFKVYGVDMLHNLSLPSWAYQVYFSICYEEFDPFYDYSVKYSSNEKYNLSKEEWELMVARYKKQDKKAKYDISNNVKNSDYNLFKDFFTKCNMCDEKIKNQLSTE